MNKRGAYFFVMDAIIATAVIVSIIMFIFSTYTIAPLQEPTLSSAHDFIQFMFTSKIRDSDNAHIMNMTLDGNITNLDNTMISQMITFYFSNKTSILENFTLLLAPAIVPPDKGMIILINGTNIYNSTLHKNADTYNSSRLAFSVKRMSFVMVNQTMIYGPVWVEVKAWS